MKTQKPKRTRRRYSDGMTDSEFFDWARDALGVSPSTSPVSVIEIGHRFRGPVLPRVRYRSAELIELAAFRTDRPKRRVFVYESQILPFTLRHEVALRNAFAEIAER